MQLRTRTGFVSWPDGQFLQIRLTCTSNTVSALCVCQVCFLLLTLIRVTLVDKIDCCRFKDMASDLLFSILCPTDCQSLGFMWSCMP